MGYSMGYGLTWLLNPIESRQRFGWNSWIGVTTNERSLAIWSNSHHLCGQILTEIKDISSNKMQFDSNVHKEESISRIKSDEVDRCNIKKSLELCIHPLEIETHSSDVLVNIYTGEESLNTSNVHNESEIGENQMKEFEKNLPNSFRDLKKLSL